MIIGNGVSIPQAGTVDTEGKSLILIDYDGTPLYAYTKAEALALTSLPATAGNHDYLTFSEWNWSLSSIQSYLSSYDCVLEVWAEYSSENNATIIFFNIQEYGIKKITINLNSYENPVTIEWGDGAADVVDSGYTKSHIYSEYGMFPVKIITNDSSLRLGGLNTPDAYLVEKIIVGNKLDLSTSAIFRNTINLKTIVLTSGVNNISATFAFSGNRAEAIVLPKSVTSLSSGTYLVGQYCKTLSLSETPFAILISQCYNLLRLSPPAGLTNFISVSYSERLSNLVIPEGVTVISGNSFRSSTSLPKITLPSTITQLGNLAFADCPSLRTVDLSALSSVPTISLNTFGSISSEAVFYVKNQSMLNAFSGATNWSSYASQMQIGGKYAEVSQ